MAAESDLVLKQPLKLSRGGSSNLTFSPLWTAQECVAFCDEIALPGVERCRTAVRSVDIGRFDAGVLDGLAEATRGA
jgi:hypothetical protein